MTLQKKIIITGGAGFIARNLAAHIQQQHPKSNITLLDNEYTSRFDEVKHLSLPCVNADIRDRDALLKAFQGQDVIIHLAADTRVVDSIKDPQFNFDNNVIGTFNVLMTARECGVGQLVAASSGGAILGNAPAPINEDMPPHPLAPYPASKLAAEAYMDAFAGAYGMHTCSLRFANIYGPGSLKKGSVIAHFMKCLLKGEKVPVFGDGEQIRDFLFIGDLVKGITSAIEKQAVGVYQLGSGIPTSVNQLVKLLQETLERDIPIEHRAAIAGEVNKTWCDISKAKRDLDFNPEVMLPEGLQITWQWFQQQNIV